MICKPDLSLSSPHRVNALFCASIALFDINNDYKMSAEYKRCLSHINDTASRAGSRLRLLRDAY